MRRPTSRTPRSLTRRSLRRPSTLVTLGAGVVLGCSVLAPGLAGATPPVVVPTPPLIATLGTPGCSPGAAGCGQALLYPSGGDVDAAGNIYTADTANGQIEAWDASGNQLWRVGQTVSNR